MTFFFFLLIDRLGVLVRTASVLTSTDNLCFRVKTRKMNTPVNPSFTMIKVGCKGVFISRTCLHDANVKIQIYKVNYQKKI